MAEENVIEFEKVPSAARLSIALQASWQLEVLMGTLVSAARKDDTTGLDVLVQAIGTRAYDLSVLIMGALHDEAQSHDSMKMILNLQRRKVESSW